MPRYLVTIRYSAVKLVYAESEDAAKDSAHQRTEEGDIQLDGYEVEELAETELKDA